MMKVLVIPISFFLKMIFVMQFTYAETHKKQQR